MSKFICALAFLTGLLVLSTPCFATTATTSTACAVNIDDGDVADPTASPVHLSQTNPVGCSFSGTSPGATYDIYSVSASSSAGSASGGLTGSLRTGEVQVSASLDTVSTPTSMSPSGTLSASALSQIESEFTTSGPLTMGTLSLTATGYGMNTNRRKKLRARCRQRSNSFIFTINSNKPVHPAQRFTMNNQPPIRHIHHPVLHNPRARIKRSLQAPVKLQTAVRNFNNKTD